MIVAYARVSTAEQSLDAQIERLKSVGCDAIFSEHESGARSDRPELAKALARLSAGDVLVVTKVDRFARSLVDFCVITDRLTKAGVAFRAIDDGLDTSTPLGRALISVLAIFAELERTRILGRTSEGRERAKAEGVHFGPRFCLTPIQVAEARRRREAGDSPAAIGRILGCSRQTVARAIAEEPSELRTAWRQAK